MLNQVFMLLLELIAIFEFLGCFCVWVTTRMVAALEENM